MFMYPTTEVKVAESKVKCFLCDATVAVDTSEILPGNRNDPCYLAEAASRQFGWLWSMGGLTVETSGWFTCCPDCFPKAIDRSHGGKVGHLKEEYEKMRRPYDR